MPKLLAAAEELIREDFYADDYVDSTIHDGENVAFTAVDALVHEPETS